MHLKEKILNVMSAVAVIGKDSRNDDVGYDYVSAAKFNAAVGAALRENRIICQTKVHVINSGICDEGTFAAVELEITLIDVDSDETLLIVGAGDGKGKNAMGAAQTMAQKYAFKTAFVVAESSDDPDANKNTNAYTPKIKTAPVQATNKNEVWLKR